MLLEERDQSDQKPLKPSKTPEWDDLWIQQ